MIKQNWYIKDSVLYYGQPGSEANPKIASQTTVASYRGRGPAANAPPLKLSLKTSINGKYCAVCPEGLYWADLYGLVQTDGAAKGKHLFSLRRNTYYTCGTQFLLEFSERKLPGVAEPETCFIFNTTHGCINVYNMEGKKVIDREYEDLFFVRYDFSANRKDIVMDTWIWAPVEAVTYYDFQRLFDDQKYKGHTVIAEEYVYFDKWIDRAKCIYRLTNGQIFMKDKLVSETEDFDRAYQVKELE